MEERQTNYTIAEGYELPSKGQIYSTKINSNVELRSMTARDEMKRLSPSNTPLKVLADIIEGCMIEKPAIHVYDMCLGDYEYLLHKLRIVSYGPEYEIGTTCPYCGKYISAKTNLEELEVKDFSLEEFNKTKSFTLPRSNKNIVLRYQTPRMLDEIDQKAKEMKRKYKTADIEFETFTRLLLSIESVDGVVLDDFALENFINKLQVMDMQKILNNIDKLNSLIGLDPTIHISCDGCGGDVQTFFRFGREFFRPSNI